MRHLNTTLLAAFLAIALGGAARADDRTATIAPGASRDPEAVREQIERLYRLEQAFLVCDHVRVTGEDLSRLDDAIGEFEATSGLAQNDLESIYEQVETLVSDSSGQFCAGMSEAANEIRAVPAADQR